MQEGHYVAFFGDSDQDMLEAKKVNVLGVRVRRGKRSVKNDSYSPGKMGEFVMPLSQF
jgi:acid phosphatase class B